MPAKINHAMFAKKILVKSKLMVEEHIFVQIAKN
jgi:hypothetical protein